MNTVHHDATIDNTTQKLLEHLHRGGEAAYYWTIGQGGKKHSHWFPAGEPAPIPSGCQHVYFGVHPSGKFKKEYKRTSKKDIAAINCFFAEFDVPKNFPDKQAIWEHLEQLLQEQRFPTFLLNTESYTWFAPLVVYGEVLIGVALIVGAFVGISAFFGAFMNWNFMMAGSASSNPMLFVVALLLIFAWKTAGYIGADFFLLRFLGTPWGRLQQRKQVRQPDLGLAPAGD